MTTFDMPEIAMLKDAAERFAAENSASSERDRIWGQFAQMGWLAIGGQEEGGLGLAGTVTIMEAMGRHALAVPYLTGSITAAAILSRSGATDALERLGTGSLRLSVDARLLAPDTQARGTDLAAVIEGERISLSGEVLAIGWHEPDSIVVGAKDATGRELLLALPVMQVKCAFKTLTLADGGAAVRIVLDSLVAKPEWVLCVGEDCRKTVDAARLETLLAASANNLGIMQSLFDRTLDYVKLRRQFGRAIGSFQALQFRLTDMWIRLDEARSLVMAAGQALEQGGQGAVRLVSAAWIQSLWSGRQIGEEAVQMHGAIGMTEECEVGRYFRQMLVNELLLGSEEAHMKGYRRPARHLLAAEGAFAEA